MDQGRVARPPPLPDGDRVTVCHILGNGSYNLLTFDDSALPAHVAHGDHAPEPAGDAVVLAVAVLEFDGAAELAGRAGGTIAPGRHLQYEKDTPLCNLYVSMLDRMGVKADRFGDSTGPLPNLGA